MQSWPIPHTRLFAVALAVTCATLATLATLAALAPRTAAIVPPTDCGMLTVKAKRYNIKADQLRCEPARTYASRYLSTRRRPSGYRCRDFGAETKLKFRCARGIRVFFAIRR
jgi:hypothetical protein